MGGVAFLTESTAGGKGTVPRKRRLEHDGNERDRDVRRRRQHAADAPHLRRAVGGAVVAGFSSTSEHLRASGGMAFAAIMLFGSLGLFREIELVVVDGIKNDGAWVP